MAVKSAPAAIAVLGSANMDLVVRSSRAARPGETIFGSSFDAVPGGKGLNQAVAAARAGGDVAFLGALGQDSFGDELYNCLAGEGIAMDGVTRVDGPSGIAAITVVDQGGENSIIVVSGANDHVATLDDTSRALITQARFLVAQLERPASLVREGLQLARSVGAMTVLTPAPAIGVDDSLLGLVDILVPNSGEACDLARTDDELAAARSLSKIARTVIMTRGRHGAVVASAGRIIETIPARVVEPVDTTAAGDTFVGVLVATLSSGFDLHQAIEAATIAASIAVTRRGASSSMPNWDEIAAVIAEP